MHRLLPCLLIASACSSVSSTSDEKARRAAAAAAGEAQVDGSTQAAQDALGAATPAGGVVLTEQNGVISAQLMSCAAGELLQSTGTGWQCAAPPQIPTFAAGLTQNGNVISVARMAQVVTVATSGGDFASIQEAIDSIKDAAEAKRYIVRVAPGNYAENVVMKQFVDIEGAGEESTVVDGSVEGAQGVALSKLSVKSSSTAIHTAQSMTLRRVTVEANNQTGAATALSVSGGAGLTASHVSLSASGSNPQALLASGGEISLRDVDIVVTGQRADINAVSLQDTKASLDHVSLQLSGGARCVGIMSAARPAQPLDMMHMTISVSGCSVSAIGIQTSFSVITDLSHSRITVNGGSLATTGLSLSGQATLFASQIRITNDTTSAAVGGVETRADSRLSDLDIDIETVARRAVSAALSAVLVLNGRTTIDRCRLNIPLSSSVNRAVKTDGAAASALIANTGTTSGVPAEGNVVCVYPYLMGPTGYSLPHGASATLADLQACP